MLGDGLGSRDVLRVHQAGSSVVWAVSVDWDRNRVDSLALVECLRTPGSEPAVGGRLVWRATVALKDW